MAEYKYKLERILNYKEKLEGIKKAQHAEINYKLNMEEERLEKFNTYKSNLLVQKCEALESVTIGHVRIYNNYLNDLSKLIVNQEEVVENTKVNLTKAKDELLIAMQEKKAFEKLKEIGKEEFINDEKKKEEKLVDSIVTFNTNTQQ